MTTSRHTILWITERYPPLSGGMAESASRQVDALRRHDWTVDVVLLHFNPDAPPMLETVPRDGGEDMAISYPDSPGNAVGKIWAELQLRLCRRSYDAIVGFGCNLPGLVAGSVIVETVFAIPGLGRLFYEAAFGRDVPVLMAMTLLSGAATLGGILFADLLYGVADPRARRG